MASNFLKVLKENGCTLVGEYNTLKSKTVIKMKCGHEKTTLPSDYYRTKNKSYCRNCYSKNIYIDSFKKKSKEIKEKTDFIVISDVDIYPAFKVKCKTCCYAKRGQMRDLLIGAKCSKCESAKGRYDIIKAKFDKGGCKLLTLREEYTSGNDFLFLYELPCCKKQRKIKHIYTIPSNKTWNKICKECMDELGSKQKKYLIQIAIAKKSLKSIVTLKSMKKKELVAEIKNL